MAYRVALNASTLGTEEIEAAVAVLRSDRLTMGHQVETFEQQFAAKMGVRHAIMVNSGSSANLLAFFALANPFLAEEQGRPILKPGDEIIVPALTWSTTIWPIMQAGCVPVLVDSDPFTLQMHASAVRAAINPKTRAICVVHVLGNAVVMDEITALAKKHNLWLIEDTCEALGTRHQGRYVGTFGDIGTYSFYFSHHITTIEGGMVVTNDDTLADLCLSMRAHGWVRHMKKGAEIAKRYPDIDSRFLFITTGFNLRPTEVNAALGIGQLKRLTGFNERRNVVADALIAEFTPLIASGHFTPMQITPDTVPGWFGFPVICRDVATRKGLLGHLENKGIETRPIIAGNLARQPGTIRFPHRISGLLDGADRVMDCGLYWGTHPMMNEADIAYISQTVKEYFYP